MSDLERLVRAAALLEPDAVAVLAYQAERMRAGQAEYGRLDLAADPRDWPTEQLMELADWINYRAMQRLLAERQEAERVTEVPE